MLEEFVTLEKGDIVVQNGANSAVGQVLSYLRLQLQHGKTCLQRDAYKGHVLSDTEQVATDCSLSSSWQRQKAYTLLMLCATDQIWRRLNTT